MRTRLQGLRSFATRIFNPLVIKFAGTRFSPFASICHVGRRSGKEYRTPIIVRYAKGGVVLPLPYGPNVDWYRNTLAAGGAVILWHGREYKVVGPTPLDVGRAVAAFAPPQKLVLRLFRIRDFALAPVKAVRRVNKR